MATLYSYDDGAILGEATPEQIEAGEDAYTAEGVFAIDSDGHPLREDEAGRFDLRVYVQ
jgi:hypothetical protein